MYFRKYADLKKQLFRGLIGVKTSVEASEKAGVAASRWSGITAKLRTLCFLHSAEPVACLLTITLISHPRASSECWVQHLFSQK